MTIQEWSNKLVEIKQRIAKFEQNIVDEALEVERLQKEKEDEEINKNDQVVEDQETHERPEEQFNPWDNPFEDRNFGLFNY